MAAGNFGDRPYCCFLFVVCKGCAEAAVAAAGGGGGGITSCRRPEEGAKVAPSRQRPTSPTSERITADPLLFPSPGGTAVAAGAWLAVFAPETSAAVSVTAAAAAVGDSGKNTKSFSGVTTAGARGAQAAAATLTSMWPGSCCCPWCTNEGLFCTFAGVNASAGCFVVAVSFAAASASAAAAAEKGSSSSSFSLSKASNHGCASAVSAVTRFSGSMHRRAVRRALASAVTASQPHSLGNGGVQSGSKAGAVAKGGQPTSVM
mmetsp:Transcript_15945/g.29492  ORF Transcript_15945/g.29492 Transcript_15945/m.29492 type:complete len:261 (-) Transcript_15945:30-812(-)